MKNFPEDEKTILKNWKQNKIFEQSVKKRAPEGDFVFYDGPPFATGLPHYGHILAGTIKDVIPRYKTMRGYSVPRRWGWDCHGLPIENLIEKEKGINSKKEIEADIASFNKACSTSVLKYREEWKDIVARTGRWVDMENDYKTMDNRYIEVIWWIFKQLYDEGLIEEGRKAMHVCPRCETTLSNFEVTLGYKEVEDMAVTWKFKVKKQGPNSKILEDGAPVYMVAWTTTPWSTLSTMGLSVGPDFKYVKVKLKDEYIICAKERLDFVMGGCGDYKIVDEFKGSELAGIEYEHIVDFYKELDEVKDNKNVYHVYMADYVVVTEGTGIVTINGSYGEIDMQAAKNNGLPIVLDVNIDAVFNKAAKWYEGMHVKKGQERLVEDMQKIGLVWKVEQQLHSYPHCWRCDTPLLNYVANSWFVKVTEIKDRLLANNNKVRWVPEHVKQGRFGKWLENARDWAISRSRYWGAPLPVWKCENKDCKAIKVIGSGEELEQELESYHRPFIDEVAFLCEKCGKQMKREEYVFDCWFESGAMPYASEIIYSDYKITKDTTREDLLKQINFPADFISEGLDQTRGWFYTLMVLSTALYNKSSFQNVIVHGIVLAKDGKKMSKRLKNYPDPVYVMDKYGADAMRFYLLNSPVMRAEELRFSEKGVDEVFKKVNLLTWNVLSFWKMYAPSAGSGASQELSLNRKEQAHALDRWIISKLQYFIKEVTNAMEAYELDKAVWPVVPFINELSTWYLRRSRDRFKAGGKDSEQAIKMLGHVLLELSKILAPFMPFLAEMLYKELGGKKESVHLDSWPEYNESLVDKALLDEMESAREVVEIVHSMRDQAQMKLRQPLEKVQISAKRIKAVSEELKKILQDELNVKSVSSADEFEKGLQVKDGVALDIKITDELKAEGALRELVRHINNLRKKQGLTINDQITLTYSTSSDNIKSVIKKFNDELKQSVLAKDIIEGHGENEINIDGDALNVNLDKILG